jgi:hypothetical protein
MVIPKGTVRQSIIAIGVTSGLPRFVYRFAYNFLALPSVDRGGRAWDFQLFNSTPLADVKQECKESQPESVRRDAGSDLRCR